MRIVSLMGVFLVLYLLIITKLVIIQLIYHSKYSSMAHEQYWSTQEIPARRGTIYSTDGRVMAGTVINYLMYGEPKKIASPSNIAKDLATILSELKFETQQSSHSDPDYKNSDEFYKLLWPEYQTSLEEDLYWVPLEHAVKLSYKEKIEELGIDGIGFEEESARYYPEDSLMAHVLGFVAGDENTTRGYFGIEGSLDEELKGKPGKIIEERDAKGHPILIGGYKKIEPVPGRDIYLTLNSSVQYLVEKSLMEGVEKYNAKSGTVIVMDPFTGEIVALANYPSYSPAEFYLAEQEFPEELHRVPYDRRNNALGVYEPGSVIKPLTIATAVDKKLVTPQTTFEDNGPVQYSDYVINNWDGAHYGTQTIIQLLQKSNNIGAAWVGHRVGSKTLSQYFSDFGLGSKTGISLEGEDTGVIRDQNTWTDIDLATIAFGQGVSASPLQVVNAFNVLANGGFLLKPKIIDKINEGGRIIQIPTKSIRQVISRETSDTLINLLESAVSGGEAKYFVIKDYKIAGKTGTAQIPENGRYSPDRTNATFVGFLSGDRKISMIVKLEEPKASIYAAETAVPLWMEIVTQLVKFYGIAPDRVGSSETL